MSANSTAETIDSWLDSQAEGNGCVLVIVNSADLERYRIVGPAVLSALVHFGIPFSVTDLAQNEVDLNRLEHHACILVAQSGMAGRLAGARSSAIRDAVRRGAGLVNLDHQIEQYDGPIQEILGGHLTCGAAVRRSALRVANGPHFVTAGRHRPSIVHLARPVETTPVRNASWSLPERPLVTTLDNLPVLVTGSYGEGRAAQWLVSPELWLNDVLGHAGGLDTEFWRSIVWAARKPFVMRAMPPFLVALIDDCSSSYNHFGYLDSFVRHGYLPHLEVFLDDVNRVFHQERDLDSRVLKARYDEGLIGVAAHAFAYNRQIYFDHDQEAAYDDALIARHFAQFDQTFASWGIQPSSFLNAHFGEIGLNALPYLLERGIRYYGGIHPFGEAWFGKGSQRYPWKPAPYRRRGFLLDYMPGHADFFAVKAQIEPGEYTSEQRTAADCLWGHTIFWDESRQNDVAAVARQAVQQLDIGWNSGFYGCLYTHEQRLAVLSMGEVDQLLDLIDESIRHYCPIPCKLDEVARYARCRRESKIAAVRIDPLTRRVSCTLTGRTDLETCVQVFEDKGTDISQRVLTVRPFQDRLAVEG
jgi:hypothetical protein